MNYKKMSFVSGIVIFWGLVIVLVSIIGLAEKRIFFSHDYIIYVKFQDIIGLRDNSHVYMRGYKIGTAKDVQFLPDGVKLRVDINKKYSIPLDSEFELNTVSMLGEKAISITPGTSTEYFKHGDFAIGQNKDLMVEAKKLIGDLRSKTKDGELRDRVQKLSATIDRLYSVVDKLDTKIDQVNIPMYNEQIKSIGDAGKSIKDLADKNNVQIESTLKQLNDAAVKMTTLSQTLDKIAVKVNDGDGSVGALVNNKEYIENFNNTLLEITTLIADLKNNPKKYIDVSVF